MVHRPHLLAWPLQLTPLLRARGHPDLESERARMLATYPCATAIPSTPSPSASVPPWDASHLPSASYKTLSATSPKPKTTRRVLFPFRRHQQRRGEEKAEEGGGEEVDAAAAGALHHAGAPDRRHRHCRAPYTAPTRHGRALSLRRPCPPRARMVSTTFASPFASVLPSHSTRR